MSNEYVTRDEFQDFANRTETRIDNLQKEMHEGFLHVTERMDEGFQRMDDKFQHLTERMDDKFAQAEKDATKRQTEGRRFWTGTIIAVIAAAAAVIAVVQNALN